MRKLLLLFSLSLVPLTHAAAPPFREFEKWTVDDVVNQESASDFRFSPEGGSVVWVKHAPDPKKNEHVGQLFRHDLKRSRTVQLTRGSDEVASPLWSPAGNYLAFLTSRTAPKSNDKSKEGRDKAGDDEPKTQIWLLDASGGEAWPVTEHPRGVQQFGWADEDTLVFTAQEEAGRRESVLKEKKDAASVAEDEKNEPPVRLFKVERESRKVTRISDNRDRIESLAVSPDGRYATALHSRSLRYLYDNRIKPAAFLHDLATGKRTRVLKDPGYNLGALLWSPNGKGFYALNARSSKPQFNQAGVIGLLYHDLATGKESEIDLGWPRGLAAQDANEYAPGVIPIRTGFLAFLADGIRHRVALYTGHNGKFTRTWVQGEGIPNVFGLAASGDGRAVAYAHSAAGSPTTWHLARLEDGQLKEPRPLPPLNKHLDNRRMARSEVTRWKGANGETVEGLLFYPHDHRPGKPAPLVVQIHGGPASADHDAWDETWAYSANLVCQRGAFVLRPNYHGSTGYGQAWMESIADGRYCVPEVEDVEKGVDALIARGLVDGKRLGLTGWSNGAILTNQLITLTDRYRAAVAGAGSIEYVSDWASCEFGDAFDRFYLGKTPLEDLDLYLRRSPFYRLGKVKTPTLILFGAEDRVVHPQQGWAQYRALQQAGNAPVRFVQFPGEKHSLKKLSHRHRKLREELAWLDRHLFGQVAFPAEALVKEDSALNWRLKRQSARKVRRFYGKYEGGVLAPETVSHGGLRVGRFEVTRAQFTAFDPKHPLPQGTDNYPVTGVSFEQAQAYCAWLSKRTGRRYRLPTESEADILYEKPGEGDNTMDAWAGYAVNLDDARLVREKMAKIPTDELLREVGSGRGVGKEELVYDLGGNAAEWIQGKEGKREIRGGSVDAPAGTSGKGIEPGPGFRSFRVVLD